MKIIITLQLDLDQQGEWAEERVLEFNESEVLHFGKSDPGRNFTVDGRLL